METPTQKQLEDAMKIAKEIKSFEKQKATAEKNYQKKMNTLNLAIASANNIIRSIMNPDEKTEEA